MELFIQVGFILIILFTFLVVGVYTNGLGNEVEERSTELTDKLEGRSVSEDLRVGESTQLLRTTDNTFNYEYILFSTLAVIIVVSIVYTLLIRYKHYKEMKFFNAQTKRFMLLIYDDSSEETNLVSDHISRAIAKRDTNKLDEIYNFFFYELDSYKVAIDNRHNTTKEKLDILLNEIQLRVNLKAVDYAESVSRSVQEEILLLRKSSPLKSSSSVNLQKPSTIDSTVLASSVLLTTSSSSYCDDNSSTSSSDCGSI